MSQVNKRQEEFWFTLLRKGDLRKLWRPEIEIIFILKGTGQVCFANTKTNYTVHETDIFVINSFEMHNFDLEEGGIALSLSFSLGFVMSINPEILKYHINCCSYFHTEHKQEPFDVLRGELARAFEEQYKNNNYPAPYLKSRAAAVLEDLSKYFLDKNRPAENKGSFESMRAAVNYIHAHFQENISLENLAEQTFLSKTYISRSFTKYFEISFTDYVTLLRLSHAARMMHGKDTLIDIAYESGFPNINAMITAFKRYRGITPGEYRKNLISSQKNTLEKEGSRGEKANEVFSSLMNYVVKTTQTEVAAEKITEISVPLNGRKQRIFPHWKRMLNAGYARSLMDGTLQGEIRYMQEKVGFEYIRIKGLLDDDMCLLREDMNGNTILNYTYVDEAMDFILSVKAKPMIELGFMPKLLAKEDALCSMRMGHMSAPKDIEKWCLLIKSLIEHLVKRYGDSNVRKWLFAPWLTPDFMDFGLCSREEYEEIYYASYSAIKMVNPDFLITGPGSTNQKEYLSWFLESCKRRKCLPDIVTFRSFASGLKKEENELNLIANNESFPMSVSADENIIQNTVREIKRILKREKLENSPLVLEEWSNNIWQRDLCNDTCYKSAYLFKNILENNQELNAMGYFALNDRMDEVPPAADTFHGGFGLFTKNDIPKSACRALELLGQMGDKLLQKGDGYFVTQLKNEIQIFLYNYCHYDLLYRYRHVVNMSKTNRYQVFVPKESQAFYIRLENVEAGNYEIRRYGITREGGSSFDEWERMGGPEPLDSEERERLLLLSHPLYRRESGEVTKEERTLSIKASLRPLDVWLIRIKMI